MAKREISLGVEVEAYTISIPDYRICRELLYPRRGTVERGERFTRDESIGIEYNSKVFRSVREALFMTKTALRKYIRKHFERKKRTKYSQSIFLSGGWRDRFAGAHIHIGLGPKGLREKEAKSLAKHIHPHIPYLIAISANSPLWRERISNRIASHRLLRGSRQYMMPTHRGRLRMYHYDEMNYNPAHRFKAGTLEIRFCDSNVPEYLCCVLTILQAIAIHWRNHRHATNWLKHEQYLKTRDNAIREGARAKLFWHHKKVTFAEYTDLMFKKYRNELRKMNVPGEVLETFRLLKKGWNGAMLLARAYRSIRQQSGRQWRRTFARRYARAIEALLNGDSLLTFARELGARLPSTKRVSLEL